MHEMSLCEDMVQLIGEQARLQGFRKVRTVRLEIGKLSCVEPEALRFAFEAVTRGTLCEGARLEIDEADGAAWCAQCRQTVAVRQRFDTCPECGHGPLEIKAGDAMRIGELEVT